MADYREIVSTFTKASTKVKKVTQPLLEHVNINYFYYYRLDIHGNLSLLTNHPDIDEYYFLEKMFLTDPYLKHPNHYRSGFFSMRSYGSDEYKEDQKKIFGAFDIHPCISLIEKNIDSFDFFGFLHIGTSTPSDLHLNHLPLLKSFAKYFKKEFSSVLLSMEEASLSILDLMGEKNFYSGIPIIPTIEKDSIRKLLLQIGMKEDILKFDSLSKREQQCLKGLAQGHSAKDTAKELNLSRRTIEHYLESIRIKFSCWNKQELFSIGRKFEDFGLF